MKKPTKKPRRKLLDEEAPIEKYVPPVRLLTQKSDWEDIVSHLIQQDGKTQLSPALEKQLEHYEYVAAELRRNPSWFFVAKRIMEKKGISKTQAFRDIEETTRIYNSISRKQYIGRDFHISNLLSDITKHYHRCITAKNYATAEKCLRDRAEILAKFYGGYEAGLYDDLQMPDVKLGFFPDLTNVEVPDNYLEIIERSLAKKKKRALYLDEDDITDVEIIPVD